MATYTELRGLFQKGSELANRVDVAIVVAAELIRAGEDDGTGDGSGFDQVAGAHDLRKVWAATAFTNTQALSTQALKAILGQNRASTVLQIEGATDAILQTAVNKAVDLLAGV